MFFNKMYVHRMIPKILLFAMILSMSLALLNARANPLELEPVQDIVDARQLQIDNENLKAQLKILQKNQSGELFIFGAVIFLTGGIFGFAFAKISYRRRGNDWR